MTLPAHDLLRRLIREELGALRLGELGVVETPHAAEDDGYTCTVRLRDSGVVLARVPVMTARKGFASVPEAGDLVLVQYLGGDANAPVITGSFYNDEDVPPPHAAGEAVLRLPLGAEEGEGVAVKLATGTPGLTLALGEALALTLADDDPVVRLVIGDGTAEIRIDSDGAVTLKTDGALTVEGGELTLKGSKITAEAQGDLVLKGAVIKLN